MAIQAGLVGLPNVGKSTLFNALTKSQIPAENYPFCTIDPHLAITEVPDKRFTKLMEIFGSKKKIPSTVQFVDIAGLVKGAASGEGLGNKFLSHIREVDLILHVVRCFEDPDIMHSGDTIDPIEDYETIVSELMLRDMDSVEKRLQKLEKQLKMRGMNPAEKKVFEHELDLLKKVLDALNNSRAEEVRTIIQESTYPTIPLLTAKNFLIIGNFAEHEMEDNAYKNSKHYKALVEKFGADSVIPVCAKVEYELSQLGEEDAEEMMNMIGLKEKSLDNIIRATYKNLGLITFFTCGPKEAHAWPIPGGMKVREAAGEIHSDLQRGFICAEVYNCKELFEAGSVAKLKDIGKVRTEGQDYLVHDGDIIVVRFNV